MAAPGRHTVLVTRPSKSEANVAMKRKRTPAVIHRPVCEVLMAVVAGFIDAVLRMLEAWVATNAVRPAGLKGLEGGRETPVPPIPRWVDALLLVVDACTHINWQPPPQLCPSCAAKPVWLSASLELVCMCSCNISVSE